MKTTFLAIIFSLGIISGHDNLAPYIGKWRNVSSNSSIKEVLFFPNHNVRFSNQTSSMLQRYSLSSSGGSDNRFTGFFEVINVGKTAKKSFVELTFLEDNMIELQIDGKKLILKKH
jgi:hypothetical protein